MTHICTHGNPLPVPTGMACVPNLWIRVSGFDLELSHLSMPIILYSRLRLSIFSNSAHDSGTYLGLGLAQP